MIFKAFWFGLSQIVKQFKEFLLFVLLFVGLKYIFYRLARAIQIESPTVQEVLKKITYNSLLWFLSGLILAAMMVCAIKLFLDIYHRRVTRLKILWLYLKRFYFKYVVVIYCLYFFYALLLSGVILIGMAFLWALNSNLFILTWLSLLGELMLIIFIFYTLAFLIFSNYILIDERSGPMRALKKTLHFSREKRWVLFFFLLQFLLLEALLMVGYQFGVWQLSEGIKSRFILEFIHLLGPATMTFIGLSMYVYVYKTVARKSMEQESSVERSEEELGEITESL